MSLTDTYLEDGNTRNIIDGTTGAGTLTGTSGDDRLTSFTGEGDIFRGAGSDCLFGGGADDSLNCGAHNDLLEGEAGADAFVFGLDFGTGPNGRGGGVSVQDFDLTEGDELFFETFSTFFLIGIQEIAAGDAVNTLFHLSVDESTEPGQFGTRTISVADFAAADPSADMFTTSAGQTAFFEPDSLLAQREGSATLPATFGARS